MQRMETITNGEIRFENIKISTDQDDYQWISFTVN